MQEDEIQKLNPVINMFGQDILLYKVVPKAFCLKIKISINNNLQMVMRNKILSM